MGTYEHYSVRLNGLPLEKVILVRLSSPYLSHNRWSGDKKQKMIIHRLVFWAPRNFIRTITYPHQRHYVLKYFPSNSIVSVGNRLTNEEAFSCNGFSEIYFVYYVFLADNNNWTNKGIRLFRACQNIEEPILRKESGYKMWNNSK